ncbi:MAG: type II toxin-antitoxin system HipA family toxin [Acidithiobacillus sp.]
MSDQSRFVSPIRSSVNAGANALSASASGALSAGLLPSAGLLRFVYEGWTKHAARYEEKTGKVRALGRGIYLPVSEPVEAVLRQALDVVAYRYDNPRLFGESARRVLEGLSPAVNGVVHIAVHAERRRERDLIPDVLKVVLHPDVSGEGMAELFLSQRKQTFQNIMPGASRGVRLPGNAEIVWDALEDRTASPSDEDATALWQNLTESERLALMANHPDGASRIKEWQAASSGTKALPLPSRQTVEVFLQDMPWGRFYDNGFAWKLDLIPNTPDFPAQIENMRPFLQSLFPETEGDKHQIPDIFLEEPRRLMNLLIRPEGDATRPVVNRIPGGAELARHQTASGLFTGEWVFPEESEMSAFPDGHPAEPKLSGMQPKAPAFLDAQGRLRMSLHEDPFTVLMKFDYGPQAKSGVPVLEWACQRVARYAGIDTPETALMVDGDGSRAALLSERFDVPGAERESPADGNNRLLFAMDGAALLGISTEAKYTASIKALWQRIQEVSRDKKDVDLSGMGEQLFDRFALAWAMADGDLHAKNVSVLFSCEQEPLAGGPGKTPRYTPWEMRLSPAYDTVCTRAIPGLGNDRMALKIEGKDDGLSPALWKRFGAMLGVADGDARASRISEKVALGLAAFAQVHPAALGLDGPYAQAVSHMLDRAAAETGRRARYMGVEIDQKAVPEMDEVMHGEKCEALAKSAEGTFSESEEQIGEGGLIEDKKPFNEVRHTSESPF